VEALVGTAVSTAAWVQATLRMSEGGCGVSSASDVVPVARLAGVLQLITRAEPLLACDRQLVVTMAGILDALNARRPPTQEPLARSMRTGLIALPDGDAG